MLLQLYGSEAAKREVQSDVNKVARCIVGAECLKKGICAQIKQKDLLLQVMKYLQCWNESIFETLLLRICQTKNDLLETILYSQPAKTLDVGYL